MVPEMDEMEGWVDKGGEGRHFARGSGYSRGMWSLDEFCELATVGDCRGDCTGEIGRRRSRNRIGGSKGVVDCARSSSPICRLLLLTISIGATLDSASFSSNTVRAGDGGKQWLSCLRTLAVVLKTDESEFVRWR